MTRPWRVRPPGQARLQHRSVAVALAVGVSVVAASLVTPATATGTTASTSLTQERAAVRHLEADLAGTEDGDPNGEGRADFRLNAQRLHVCATVTYSRIGRPNAAHIHRQSDGGVVVDLTGSVTGGAKCATNVKRKLIRRILETPRRYYFNVHNTTFPAGAIQGTLHR